LLSFVSFVSFVIAVRPAETRQEHRGNPRPARPTKVNTPGLRCIRDGTGSANSSTIASAHPRDPLPSGL
jgi:hypothetical protein